MAARGPRDNQPTDEPGWWIASDGKWYPPESRSATEQTQAPSQAWAGSPPNLGQPTQTPSSAWTPTKPKRKKWPIIIGIIAIIIVIGAIAGAAGGNDKKTSATATTTPPTAARSVTTASAPTVPAGPIFTQSGNGTATTATFKVPNDWNLAWSYDCTGTFGGTGNFITTNYDYDSAISGNGNGGAIDLDNQGVNQLAPKGQGVEHYHSGGNTKYIKVVSECAWAFTVTKG